MVTFDDILEALEGHTEFAIHKYGNELVSFDYIIALRESFDAIPEEIESVLLRLLTKKNLEATPENLELYRPEAAELAKKFAMIRRQCRGVTFHEPTKQLLSLPLHKFFNVNQTEDTQFNLLKDLKAMIYEKLDGSMIHCFRHPVSNELMTATCRSADSDQAKDAAKFLLNSPLVSKKILDTLEDGWTPIFEYVAAHNQIVVEYPFPRLVYLISRNRTTGEYAFQEGFPDTAQRYEFKFGDIFNYVNREEFEGYVCHLENGMIVKAKTPWYIERHHAVDALMRPKYRLYEYVFTGIMDDLIAFAPDRYKKVLQQIMDEGQHDLLQEKLRLNNLFNEITNLPVEHRRKDKVLRKAFVQLIDEWFKEDRNLLLSLYIDSDPTETIVNRLMEKYKIKYPNRLFAQDPASEGQ